MRRVKCAYCGKDRAIYRDSQRNIVCCGVLQTITEKYVIAQRNRGKDASTILADQNIVEGDVDG